MKSKVFCLLLTTIFFVFSSVIFFPGFVLTNALAETTSDNETSALSSKNIEEESRKLGVSQEETKDTLPPVLTAVLPPADGWYREGQEIRFILSFNEDIVAIAEHGIYLDLDIGFSSVRAHLNKRTIDSSQLIFTYRVEKSVFDNNGIRVGDIHSVFPKRQLSDAAGNSISYSLDGLRPVLTEVKVDGVAPRVSQLVYPAAGNYRSGVDTLNFTVIFDEPVAYQDKSASSQRAIQLDIGGTQVAATYQDKLDHYRTEHQFSYQLAPGLKDSDGIEITSLWLDAGKAPDRLVDRAGNQVIMSVLETEELSIPAVVVYSSLPQVVALKVPQYASYLDGGTQVLATGLSEEPARPAREETNLFDQGDFFWSLGYFYHYNNVRGYNDKIAGDFSLITRKGRSIELALGVDTDATRGQLSFSAHLASNNYEYRSDETVTTKGKSVEFTPYFVRGYWQPSSSDIGIGADFGSVSLRDLDRTGANEVTIVSKNFTYWSGFAQYQPQARFFGFGYGALLRVNSIFSSQEIAATPVFSLGGFIQREVTEDYVLSLDFGYKKVDYDRSDQRYRSTTVYTGLKLHAF